MHAQLEQIAGELEAATARLRRLALAVPEDRWSARANPNSWSVGENIAHLNLTSEAFIPQLRAALMDDRFRGVPAPARYRRDPAGFIVSIVAGPLPRFRGKRLGRVKTMASMVPSGDAPRGRMMADFERLQQELVSLLRDADGRPIQRMRVRSPFDPRGRLTYNVYAAFVTLPRHQQRHLDQADEVWGTST